MKNRELKNFTFEELVETAAQHIHSALLEGGGKTMKSEVYLWLSAASRWEKERIAVLQKELRVNESNRKARSKSSTTKR